MPVALVQEVTIVPELAPAPELPHAAFAEKFTPMPDPPLTHTAPVQQLPPTLPAPAGISMEPAKPDPAPPADQVQPNAAERAPDEQRSDARDGHENRQRPGSEPSPPPRFQVEPATHESEQLDPSRFQPAAPVSASPRPTPPEVPSSPASTPKPADVQPGDIDLNRLQPAPAPHTVDAHSISLRVTDAGDQRVDLKITDRGGEVKVAVRAADPNLAGSLRENLGDLVHRLEQGGLRAENWQPAQSSSAGSRQMRQAEGESPSGDPSGRQQQAGDGRDRRQQDRPQRAAWLEEFESSFSPDSERSSTPWLPA